MQTRGDRAIATQFAQGTFAGAGRRCLSPAGKWRGWWESNPR